MRYWRTCDCPPGHLNCLSAKEWLKAQIGVWRFAYERRDVRDKTVHPAVYPIALADRCIQLYTHRGELVLDPFVGSGTTLVAARDTGRNAVGFDLSADYVAYANERLASLPPVDGTAQVAIHDDARNIPKYFAQESVALICTSPPYAGLLNRLRRNKSRRTADRRNDQYLRVEQYSQDPCDLGTLSVEQYQDALAAIFGGLLPLLRRRAHCVINVGNLWLDNRRVALHTVVIAALEAAGYELRNIVIWDRTNLVNRTGIFGWPSNYITMGTTFEYILDFWRP